ncbi:DUF1501 domain-containing protein [Gimesia panareensis]|uniref:DUF1501 domain-containing protein n=1 Tax=Gimesia panareensis TaxID=2527978 RepID=UPI00118B2CF5|nr:DUF1501 domain-containing protein [Gimesia panareensis]QDU49531.1 hypothetical protein Pan110_18690 [Gimesia panareensis]
MFSRRQFLDHSLQSTAAIALGTSLPGFLAQTQAAPENTKSTGRILVVIELTGGNDGLNTVIPYAHDQYRKNRKTLQIKKSQVLKIDEQTGLHPSLKPAAQLLEEGRLAIVQGVGYPNPNRSHFESMEIWQSAVPGAKNREGTGWLGRMLDLQAAERTSFTGSCSMGDSQPPLALQGRQAVNINISQLDELKLDSYYQTETLPQPPAATDDLLQFVTRQTSAARASSRQIAHLLESKGKESQYPHSGLAERLQSIAQMIRAGFEIPVYYTAQSGYDTHSAQRYTHARLLSRFSRALQTFLDDLQAAQLADRVLVLAFSEFGRRVAENDSQGTDHGTAGPVFLAGPAVKSGLQGTAPRLDQLIEGDLQMTTDFRSIYATILSQWLNVDPGSCLNGKFPTLDLLRTERS